MLPTSALLNKNKRLLGGQALTYPEQRVSSNEAALIRQLV